MNEILKEAMDLKETIVKDRRHIHMHPETGPLNPNTANYVKQRLSEMGYDPKDLGEGVVTSIGNGKGKTILLRADMDALPMQEESSVDFKSKNQGVAHTCGHDLHTSMLLGAAKLLKEKENEINGTVKFMFQPNEEELRGAQVMIDAGVLEGVDAAVALHCMPGEMKPGGVVYGKGAFMASQDRFEIKVKGQGGHGAMPHLGIDPINTAAHILINLQEIVAREINATQPTVITVGTLQAGTTANIIPETAELTGTIRSLSNEARELAKKRLVEIAKDTAKTFRCECEVEYVVESPMTYNNEVLGDELISYVKDLGVQVMEVEEGVMGSEDFAIVSEHVPSLYMPLFTGGEKDAYQCSVHNPKVEFNEDSLPYGTAILTQCALEYLKHHN